MQQAARHLLGVEPDAYVISRYEMAVGTVAPLQASTAWDRTLLAIARWSVLSARCVDAHAALFDRSATVRKRLVMLLAILETRSPFSNRIDAVPAGPAISVVAVVARGLVSLLALAAGTIVLLPLRLLFIGRGATRS